MGAEGGVSVAGSWSSWAQLPLERFLIVNRIFRVGDVSLTGNDQTELHIFKSRRSNIFRDGMGWSANLDLPPGEEDNIFSAHNFFENVFTI